MWVEGDLDNEFEEVVDNYRNYLSERLAELRSFHDKLKLAGNNEILRNKLWIGDSADALQYEHSMLRKHKIDAIVSIGSSKSSYSSSTYKDIEYHRIVCQDDELERLDVFFEDASAFIHSHNRVLVHCQAGVSRSATICIAYLMKYHHLSWEAGYLCVKVARPMICPNIGFLKQLQDYQLKL